MSEPVKSNGKTPGAEAIADFIDLHTFHPRDLLSVVDEYLFAAFEAGLDEVRIIHGKGKGVQRDRVRRLLEHHPLVESFRDGTATRGHWGAQIVTLKADLPDA